MRMRKRIVVTGMGCITPVGNDVETAWAKIIAGESGAGPITRFDTAEYKTKIAAEVKDFDGEAHFGRRDARRMDIVSQYTLAAARQAIENAALNIRAENRDRIGAVIGTGIGGIATLYENMQTLLARGPGRVSPFLIPRMLPDTPGGMLAIHLGIRAINYAVVTACATGTNALGEAAATIRRGDAEVMLAGGAEAAIVPITLAGMNVMGALSSRNDAPQQASRPFDARRDGFVMGEGAAVLVLESLEFARRRNAPILAELRGYGATNDAYHLSAPAENGAGAAACMQRAINDANLEMTQIGYINAHGTSTVLNDKSETTAIKSVFGEYARQLPVSSTKSMTGHMIGAAGAVEAIFCIKALWEETLPPTINYQFPDPACDLDYVPNTARRARVDHILSNSFGFGGHNASIIISRYHHAETGDAS